MPGHFTVSRAVRLVDTGGGLAPRCRVIRRRWQGLAHGWHLSRRVQARPPPLLALASALGTLHVHCL